MFQSTLYSIYIPRFSTTFVWKTPIESQSDIGFMDHVVQRNLVSLSSSCLTMTTYSI